MKCRCKAVELLLSRGADVNLKDDHGRTALSYAVEHGANDIVKILVKNNVDPDIADNDGNTALIHAARVGNDIAIEILIKSFRRLGLDVDKENKLGMTALLVAAKHCNVECATLLAQDGKASVSKRDRLRNMTAEEWAREQGCTTPEILPFSQFPNKNRIRLNKYYRENSLGYKMSIAKMYGGTIDDMDLLPMPSHSEHEEKIIHESPPITQSDTEDVDDVIHLDKQKSLQNHGTQDVVDVRKDSAESSASTSRGSGSATAQSASKISIDLVP